MRTILKFTAILLVAFGQTLGTALAQGAPLLGGTVVGEQGEAVSGALVQVAGQNLQLSSLTDKNGRFAFSTLTIGEYELIVTKGSLRAEETVQLTGAGVDLRITLGILRTIASAIVVRSPIAARAGTDTTLDGAFLTRMPSTTNMADILTELPSAARGSNGQIHINGDHNGLNYYLDGVQLPASLNRVVGTEIDPSDIGFIDALQGAYPAQYGDRFATVVDIGTRAYAGLPGASFELRGGSLATWRNTLGYHGAIGEGGSFSFTSEFNRTNRAIDPPASVAPHNNGSGSNEFLRINVPAHGVDTVNVDILRSLQTFQIPPDIANGVPANTDDNEFQNDLFVSLLYRHAIGARGTLSFGPSFKQSHILDTNDLTNDLAGGSGTTCTDFSDCSFFSVFADRTARDYRVNVDYDIRSLKHEVRSGALYGTTVVNKNYVITLQPGNALTPGGVPFVATDSSPNVAHQQEAYVQDSWKMGDLYELDYGLRMDAFRIFSSNFSSGFAQLSPRLKLTRMLGSKASVYAYYGRLFEPFSFETVDPATAASLYTAADNPGLNFDLKPERDSWYEIGGHILVGTAQVGLRLTHRAITDDIDDTQVSGTNLHQDINFPVARNDIQSISFSHSLARGGRVYASVTHSWAQNSSNCETQLLQNCAANGPPDGPLTPADHDQRWDANAGLLLMDRSGGWLAVDSEYGSGLTMGDGKVPPHLVFDLQKGFPIGSNLEAAFGIQNALNDRYAITLNSNLQGTHYARPRTFDFLIRSKR